MSEFQSDLIEVNARIVYWGVEGAGKTTNLHAVYAKLRPDHRGELRELPTRLDPSVSYEILPIELGDIAGVRTQIQIVSLPGAPEQAPTRKQLIDQVDGVVLVIDSQRERIEENVASFDELRGALHAYGRSLEDLPLVIQYNKRDLADPFALEELHRKLDLSGVSVFEAVATEGTGVLQTLSTISKKVIRSLRSNAQPMPMRPRPQQPEPPMQPVPSPIEAGLLGEEKHDDLEGISATVRQAEALLDVPWDRVSEELAPPSDSPSVNEMSIVSVGEASRASERAVRVPLVLGDLDGRTTSVLLTIQIDAIDETTGD